MRTISVVSALFLTACVTINIYFPAAAAEKVADEIIKGIQTEEATDLSSNQHLLPQANQQHAASSAYYWIGKGLNLLIPPAQAAGVDFSVDTAEIRRLRSAMQSRFSSLKAFYAQGVVGIKADGLLTSRGNVPLKDRNKVKKLIATENADRQQLYQAIANANQHPEWAAQIKSTFANRWRSNAQSGWWYQSSNGNWAKK